MSEQPDPIGTATVTSQSTPDPAAAGPVQAMRDAATVSPIHVTLATSLILSALAAAAFSLHWPLVGDASLIHYIAFLIERGWAPYRQLGDMNMPGSFLVELAAMHLFGPGALAWRVFDLCLALAASAAFFVILSPPAAEVRPSRAGVVLSGKCASPRWFAPLFAACLFFLIHIRDGLAQGGQRDLTMAVALAASTAFLLRAIRDHLPVSACTFGLLSGLAVTIKPTTILLTAAQLLLAWHGSRRPERPDRRTPARLLAPVTLGFLVAPALSLALLVREHALRAFFAGLHTLVPYYASLGHRPAAYVLQHSLSPILPLMAVWLAALLLFPQPLSLERRMLIAGAVFGLVNCLIQQRALPYYRYPLLAFLLPLITLDLTLSAFPSQPYRSGIASWLPLAGLAFGALILAPQSALLIHRYRWQQPEMLTSLQRELEALGGGALSGRIQCIDSISGCNTVLFRMRLEPATGVLSDFLLFGNTTDHEPPDAIPVLRDTRAAFAAALLAHPPEVIVVTSHLHMTGPEDFGKLARWPAFAAFLDARYMLATQWSPSRTERWWSREELPASFRIYRLRATP